MVVISQAVNADIPEMHKITRTRQRHFAGHCWRHEEPVALTL